MHKNMLKELFEEGEQKRILFYAETGLHQFSFETDQEAICYFSSEHGRETVESRFCKKEIQSLMKYIRKNAPLHLEDNTMEEVNTALHFYESRIKETISAEELRAFNKEIKLPSSHYSKKIFLAISDNFSVKRIHDEVSSIFEAEGMQIKAKMCQNRGITVKHPHGEIIMKYLRFVHTNNIITNILWVSRWFVNPAQRKRGLGRYLQQVATSIAKANNCFAIMGEPLAEDGDMKNLLHIHKRMGRTIFEGPDCLYSIRILKEPEHEMMKKWMDEHKLTVDNT